MSMLNGAEGVGLYRMERVYLGRVVPPNAAPLICGLSRFQISNKFFKAPLGYDYIINSAGFLHCSGIQYTIRSFWHIQRNDLLWNWKGFRSQIVQELWLKGILRWSVRVRNDWERETPQLGLNSACSNGFARHDDIQTF